MLHWQELLLQDISLVVVLRSTKGFYLKLIQLPPLKQSIPAFFKVERAAPLLIPLAQHKMSGLFISVYAKRVPKPISYFLAIFIIRS